MNTATRTLVGANSGYSLVDIQALVTAKPQEFPWRHATPFIALWSLFPILNALPAADSVLDSCVYAPTASRAGKVRQQPLVFTKNPATVKLLKEAVKKLKQKKQEL